ncbi:MAG: hypothetical protein K2K63_13780 [Acetatifactor sp.]|nr:hypothetical protein [Acetatifactor sp.]
MSEKKMWEQPKAVVQKFTANEYVAACWNVACSVTGYDAVGGNHRAQFCGDGTHYQIMLDDNLTPISMTETQTDNMGDLPCTLYTDGSYSTKKNIQDVQYNETLYWTTQFGEQTWRHQGTTTGTSNHS